MLFNGFHEIARVILMALMAYAWLVLVLRFTGKRTLSKLNAFDLVITIALGSCFATVILSKDVAFAEGAMAFSMLALMQWVVARLSVGSPLFKSLTRSDPRLLFEDGAYRDAAMAEERVTQEEVEAAMRREGFGRLDEVGAVVLETDGSMSVVARQDAMLTTLTSVRR